LEDGPKERTYGPTHREGIQFIKGNKDRPFFYIYFLCGHTPLQANKGLYLKYDNKFNLKYRQSMQHGERP